jgi:hypothetical protein
MILDWLSPEADVFSTTASRVGLALASGGVTTTSAVA